MLFMLVFGPRACPERDTGRPKLAKTQKPLNVLLLATLRGRNVLASGLQTPAADTQKPLVEQHSSLSRGFGIAVAWGGRCGSPCSQQLPTFPSIFALPSAFTFWQLSPPSSFRQLPPLTLSAKKELSATSAAVDKCSYGLRLP
jgi:hypothetical protein